MHNVSPFPAKTAAVSPMPKHSPLRSGMLYTLARHGLGLTHEAATQKLSASLAAVQQGPDISPEAA
jgi:hypothetical protein